VQPFYAIVTSASQASLPRLHSQPEAMTRNPSMQNTAEAVSRLRQYGLRPSFERAGGSMAITGAKLNPSTEVDWAKCSQTIAELLAPADEESLVAWIGRLGVLVAKKERDGDVSELELIAYAQKLQEWPGDVVREVLNRYPDDHKWWPEWATLRALLAEAAGERMALAAAYRRWIEAPEFMARREGISAPPEPPKPSLPAITGPQEVKRERDLPVHDMTPEEIDAKRKAMQAAILRNGD
jgi:hypothetical protein